MKAEPGQHAQIRDARTGETVSGKIQRVYALGLTIEDKRGIIHYTAFDRVLSILDEKPKPAVASVFD